MAWKTPTRASIHRSAGLRVCEDFARSFARVAEVHRTLSARSSEPDALFGAGRCEHSPTSERSANGGVPEGNIAAVLNRCDENRSYVEQRTSTRDEKPGSRIC